MRLIFHLGVEMQIPLELKHMIFDKLEKKDLLKLKVADKTNHQEITEYAETTLPAKLLFQNKEYFAIGPKIQVSEPGGISQFYNKPKKNISANVIKNNVPKEGEVILFRSEREAKLYASYTEEREHAVVDKSPIIYTVQLKNTVSTNVITENLKSRSMGMNRENTFEFVKVRASELEFIIGQVRQYPEVKLNEENKNCLVM